MISEIQTIKTESSRRDIVANVLDYFIVIIFTQPLRSGRIWHKVNF